MGPYVEASQRTSAAALSPASSLVTSLAPRLSPDVEVVLEAREPSGCVHLTEAQRRLLRFRSLGEEASEALEQVEELERAKAELDADLLDAYERLARVQDEQFTQAVSGPAEHVAAERMTVTEIALATGVGEQEVARRMAVATEPARHAHARSELAAGRTTLQRVLQVAEATAQLPDHAVADVERAAFAPGRDGGPVSAATFRRRLRRCVTAADPRPPDQRREERHVAARAGRTAYGRLTEDGMGVLTMVDTAERVVGILERADSAARALRAGGDPRTLDQLRCDLIGDAVLHSCDSDSPGAAAPAARVWIVVPFEVAAGVSDAPCELPGHGWVTAAHARDIMTASGSTWQRLAVDVDTGRALELSTDAYRPTAAMVAAVRARDGRCRGPGCEVPAERCDVDHQQPWPDGPTELGNLFAASRGCHNRKTARLWTSHPAPDGGLRWTTLARRDYITYPRDWREALRDQPPCSGASGSGPPSGGPAVEDPPPF